MTKTKIGFFGSSDFSIFCLEELKALNLLPDLIITTPDRPVGRGLKLSPTQTKLWAQENGIVCLTPKKLDAEFQHQLKAISSNLFLVASYGKIIPNNIIDLPKYGTLNIHPSLLPKYRGPSPLQEQILNDEKTVGVTIMLLDEKVDHGPIIAQKNISVPNWPVSFGTLQKTTAQAGAELFGEILPAWITGKIKAKEQNHSEATFTKKTQKTDGAVDITDGNRYKNYLKFLAYSDWPGAYFFAQKGDKKIRVIIKDAEYKDNQLVINKVLPEGRRIIGYQDFLRGLK